MKRNTSSRPTASEQALLEEVRVILLSDRAKRRRLQRLLHKHDYLGSVKAVGEQLYYAVVDAQAQWVALLLFSAAAQHLKHRDQWIGWTRHNVFGDWNLAQRRVALDALHTQDLTACELVLKHGAEYRMRAVRQK